MIISSEQEFDMYSISGYQFVPKKKIPPGTECLLISGSFRNARFCCVGLDNTHQLFFYCYCVSQRNYVFSKFLVERKLSKLPAESVCVCVSKYKRGYM